MRFEVFFNILLMAMFLPIISYSLLTRDWVLAVGWMVAFGTAFVNMMALARVSSGDK